LVSEVLLRPARFALTALLITIAAGCTALPAPEPRQFLDERTGVTLSVVDAPLVLARERRGVAANARDYLTLVAAERDLAGKRQLILLVHRWSTIDSRVGASDDDDSTRLTLLADGRDIHLVQVTDRLPVEFSQDERLLRPPVDKVVTLAYPTDIATLRYLVSSRQLSASFDAAKATLPYTMWRDGRESLRQLLDSVAPN
jgi:hypothetical protein